MAAIQLISTPVELVIICYYNSM